MNAAQLRNFVDIVMALKGTRGGLTYNEIMELSGTGCARTVERHVKVIKEFFGTDFTEVPNSDNYKIKKFKLSTIDLKSLVNFAAEELVELGNAIEALENKNHKVGAHTLTILLGKLMAVSRKQSMVESDLGFLAKSEIVVEQPSVRAPINRDIFNLLRRAILEELEVQIAYRKLYTNDVTTSKVLPYGFIYGKRNYLVASKHHGDMRQYALANISSVELLDYSECRDEDFDLKEYASRSIGIFQGDTADVVLRFTETAKEDARNFHFHHSQEFEELDDGRLEVRLTASGMRELCYHLFTWSGHVEIVSPESLRTKYKDILNEALQSVE